MELSEFLGFDIVINFEVIVYFFIFEFILIEIIEIIFDLLFCFMERDETLIVGCVVGSGGLYFFVIVGVGLIASLIVWGWFLDVVRKIFLLYVFERYALTLNVLEGVIFFLIR